MLWKKTLISSELSHVNHLATQIPKHMVTTLGWLGWRWKVGCLLGGGGRSGGGCCIKIVGKSMGCVYRVITSYPAYFLQQQKEKIQCFDKYTKWQLWLRMVCSLFSSSADLSSSTNKMSVFTTHEDNFFVDFVNMGGRWKFLQDLLPISLIVRQKVKQKFHN